MPKKVVEQKLITVNSAGTITELGGISGPVLNPCWVPIPTINVMLNHHRRVYEVNPKNYNEKIPLSLKNLTKKNFDTTESSVDEKPRLAPNIFTEATVTNSNEAKAKDMKAENDMVTVKKSAPTSTPKTTTTTPPTKEEKKVETPTSDFTKNS